MARTIKVTIRRGDNLWFADSEDWPGCHLAFPQRETLLTQLVAAAEHAFEDDVVTLLVEIPITGIPISVVLGECGLYYGTSPALKGLLVVGESIAEVMGRVPQAIAEMRAVTAEERSKNETSAD